MRIETVSVKVMRSHDYCHFETGATATIEPGDNAMIIADAMRKSCMRLADKAVEQYKIAKRNAELRQFEALERHQQVRNMEHIRATPEGERTVNQAAELKAFDDAAWSASHQYDYQDDWRDNDDN